jgi:hypothetical protein
MLKFILEGHFAAASTTECIELALALRCPEEALGKHVDETRLWQRLDDRQKDFVNRFRADFQEPLPEYLRAAIRRRREEFWDSDWND